MGKKIVFKKAKPFRAEIWVSKEGISVLVYQFLDYVYIMKHAPKAAQSFYSDNPRKFLLDNKFKRVGYYD